MKEIDDGCGGDGEYFHRTVRRWVSFGRVENMLDLDNGRRQRVHNAIFSNG